MGITNKYQRLPTSDIIVKRESRQRKKIEVESDGLLDSVLRFGVLQPVLVDDTPEGFVLVAGERRYAASIAAGIADIPVRFVKDLSRTELEIIELDENLKRSDLAWRDQVSAVYRIHELHKELDPSWSGLDTANTVHLKDNVVSRLLRVGRDLDNPAIANCTSYAEAYGVLSRRDERAEDDALSEILETTAATFNTAEPVPVGASAPPPPLKTKPEPEQTILHEDFIQWSASYTGRKFNLIHCDFPYGIDAFSGEQSGKTRQRTYGDQAELYWALIEALCKNLDNVMAHSGHIMFWLSADIDIMSKTLATFATQAPSLEFAKKPLIWHKTDNVGVLANPTREPRHVYETALIARREDRPVVRATSDTYGAPTNKKYHPSTKPEPVLRYFFRMFVDEHTRLLDPTCGSGTALRAAESMGAAAVLGLETDEEHCDNARRALRSARVLASAGEIP